MKSRQYFNTSTQNVSLKSVNDWLSYDIDRFKIEVGVEEKFMCKNVTKQTQHSDCSSSSSSRGPFISGCTVDNAYNAYNTYG